MQYHHHHHHFCSPGDLKPSNIEVQTTLAAHALSDNSMDYTAESFPFMSMYTFGAVHFMSLFSLESKIKNLIRCEGAMMGPIRSEFSMFVICLLSNDYIGSDNGYLKPIHVNL